MKLNEGLIYTNDNCIGCNHCISGCPVLGANISVTEGETNRIYVDGDACIHCGKCLEVCPHNAREYRDDTAAFLKDLRAGEKISLLVAPSFFAVYEEKAEDILGQLHSLGVNLIYDVSYGADIATWAYLSYLEQNKMDGAIAPPCTANMNYIRKYSKTLTEKIIPVYSPVLCLAQYIRRYVKLADKLAFLSPCIAKKDEFTNPGNEGLVQYNVTFAHLVEVLKSEQCMAAPVHVEMSDYGLGRIFPVPGGLGANVEQFVALNETVREIHGTTSVYSYFRRMEKRVDEKKTLPYMIDCLNCSFGCLEGPGTERLEQTEDEVFIRLQQYREPNPKIPKEENPYLPELPLEERRKRLKARFAGLVLKDFLCSYDGGARERNLSLSVMRGEDEAKLDKIFREMYKTTKESRYIDCHSCGYGSCREMAMAIAKGYNTKENCIHYQKDYGIRRAMRDPRYDIYNNNAYMNFLKRMIEQGKQEEYVCLLFTIHNLSMINQNYGYQQAEIIMRLYCSLITARTEENEIVALMGNTHFVAAIHKERLEKVIEQLTTGVSVPFLPGEELRVAAKVAVYWPQKQDTSASMISERLSTTYSLLLQDKTKMVMYHDHELRKRLEEEDRIFELIEPALEHREFEVYYQPKVDMHTRQLIGAEALIRWNHDGQVISPAKFVPLCEKRGMIEKLDFFVLERVCESISKWIAQGIRAVPVSINFSKHHFVNRDVAEQINAIAEKYNTPRTFLEIEFTETAYLEDSEGLIYSINRLHELGIASSMDDFGTGYSSLSMLQEMSFDTLKLDKSFLDDERYAQHRGRTVIESIIHMAKRLDMTIVSEGIETEEELAFMRNMRCDVAQGFLFDKPLRHDDFEERLKAEFYPEKLSVM